MQTMTQHALSPIGMLRDVNHLLLGIKDHETARKMGKRRELASELANVHLVTPCIPRLPQRSDADQVLDCLTGLSFPDVFKQHSVVEIMERSLEPFDTLRFGGR